jgi:predicted PurR-regulated permease PerM
MPAIAKHKRVAPAASAKRTRAPFPDPRLLVNQNATVVTAWCALVLLILACGAAFYAARSYLLPIVAAFVLSVLLAPPVGALENLRVPRVLAAAGAVLGLCAMIYIMIGLVAEPAASWASNSSAVVEAARGHLERFHSTMATVEEISSEVEELTGDPNAREIVVQGPGLTQALATSARQLTVQIVFALVMTYFFLITRTEIRHKTIMTQSRLSGRLRVARVFRDVEKGVAVYISTLAMVNIGLGASVAAAMWMIGVPSPIMWGGLAAVLNFVPYFGPALLTLLLGAAGLVTFETLAGAAVPAIVYIALNFMESNLVTPLLLGRRMTLNPLTILLAVSFWTWIWGPVGGVLSIPMLIMLKVVCEHTRVLQPFGDFIGGPLVRDIALKPIGARLIDWRRLVRVMTLRSA